MRVVLKALTERVKFIFMVIQFSNSMIKSIIYLVIFIFFIHKIYAEGYIKAKNGIEWDSQDRTYTAKGNVVFKNDKLEANSDKMIANYIEENDSEVFTVVEFYQNVVIYFKEEIFKGDYAIYTKNNSIIKLNGNVSILSPNRLLTGDELIVDLINNKRTLNSNSNESLVEVLIEDNENN